MVYLELNYIEAQFYTVRRMQNQVWIAITTHYQISTSPITRTYTQQQHNQKYLLAE